MIFSSAFLIIFLLITVSIYYVVPARWKAVCLLLASYLFCISYGTNALIVLISTTLISYFFGIILNKICISFKGKKAALLCLWCGVICCMLPLILGKTGRYGLFAAVGVSFYTLQEIAYLADIYYGKERAEKNLIKYALFIAFFPKLVSGPIERSSNLLRQIEELDTKSFEYNKVKSGFILMLWGYFQKSVIADSFAVYVDNVYGQWEGYSGMVILLATILFAFQLYADFAGYTNIAIGAAQVLGIELQENFRQPYLAVSIKDFWRRWHISLSSWLRDYIYIPLGGNRRGKINKYVNLMITFIVSGLWHGASFNYIAWGMLHGVYQIAGDVWQKARTRLTGILRSGSKGMLSVVVSRIGVFIWVNLAWIFFRASGLKSALKIIYKCVFDFSKGDFMRDIFLSLNLSVWGIAMGAALIIFLILVDVLHEKGIHFRSFIERWPLILRWGCYMGIVLILTFVEMRRCGIEASNFIYMQF